MTARRIISPSPRQRRAVAPNATTGLVEAVYITKGREAYTENRAKSRATKLEKDALTACHVGMLAEKVGNFSVLVGNTMVDFTIASDKEYVVDTPALFARVKHDGMTQEEQLNSITMAQFVECVTPSKTAIKRVLGTNFLNGIVREEMQDAKLTMKARRE